MKWEKNCGDQRNCGNRLEKEIKKKNVRLVKNYKNKNTQTNKLIISTMSMETTHFFRRKKKKETNLFEIGDGDEVSKKLRQSKSSCKKTEKRH